MSSLFILGSLRITKSFFFKTGKLSLHSAVPLLYVAPIKLKMPSLSPTMTEGNIVKWHKKEGDKVVPGDVLMEIQTDKAVISYEIDEEGTIAKILIPEDSRNIKVGSLVGLMVLPGDDWKNVKIPEVEPEKFLKEEKAATEKQQVTVATVETPVANIQAQTFGFSPAVQHRIDYHNLENLKIGPAAKNLLISYQINPKQISSNGQGGFIFKNDVIAYINKNKLKPQVSFEISESTLDKRQSKLSSTTQKGERSYVDIELSNMRRTIATRLLESKTITPHSYISSNAVIDRIVDIRNMMINKNQKVSINDFIIKATALSLRIIPELNSNYNEKTGEYRLMHNVDVSVAVATDTGLITPIVKDADKLEVLGISEKVKELADKARQNMLKLNEFQGGSFSISNLGMFGIKEFTAIINPPQVAILAVGKSQLTFSSQLKKQTEMTFCLCYDERHVRLDRARTFLSTLSYFIANPELLVDLNQPL